MSARVGAGSDAVTSTGVPVGFDAEAFWRFGGGLGSGRVGAGNDAGSEGESAESAGGGAAASSAGQVELREGALQ